MSSLSIRLIICNYFYYKLEIKFHFFLQLFDFFSPHNNINSTTYLIVKKEKGKKKRKKDMIYEVTFKEETEDIAHLY